MARELTQEASGEHEFNGLGYELCVSQEELCISNKARPQVREAGVVKILAVFDDVTDGLVGLFATAPWVLRAFDGVEVSVERDFLRPHLDEDGGFGLVGEVLVEFVNMSVESHARALPPFFVEHAGGAVPPVPVPTLPGEGVDHSLA